MTIQRHVKNGAKHVKKRVYDKWFDRNKKMDRSSDTETDYMIVESRNRLVCTWFVCLWYMIKLPFIQIWLLTGSTARFSSVDVFHWSGGASRVARRGGQRRRRALSNGPPGHDLGGGFVGRRHGGAPQQPLFADDARGAVWLLLLRRQQPALTLRAIARPQILHIGMNLTACECRRYRGPKTSQTN